MLQRPENKLAALRSFILHFQILPEKRILEIYASEILCFLLLIKKRKIARRSDPRCPINPKIDWGFLKEKLVNIKFVMRFIYHRQTMSSKVTYLEL